MPASINMTRDEAYREWLASVKRRIHAARMKIALSANRELIAWYYELGAQISERESTAQWGTGFIDAFSRDLKLHSQVWEVFLLKIYVTVELSSAFIVIRQFGNRPLPNWTPNPGSASMPSLRRESRRSPGVITS